MKMSTQVDLFTTVEPTSVSPAIAKPFVSRSTFYQGDCLVEMDKIADKSVDMILCDLPYGTTACKWDVVIPFEPLWEQYERIIKDNGAICLFGSEPFSSYLRMSNIKNYKYDWVWIKAKPSNFLMGKKQPMKYTENILIFYKKQPTYNPIMIKRDEKNKRNNKKCGYLKYEALGLNEDNKYADRLKAGMNDYIYPRNYLYFSQNTKVKYVHPTQKPVELCEYLIKTYTNEGETVLDNCMGSGTTGVACKKTGRHFIGIEKDEKYFEIAVSRVSAYCG
jgi:DNA modification methylase